MGQGNRTYPRPDRNENPLPQPLPNDMKVEPPHGEEAFGRLGAYLMVRERNSRYKTHRNIDLMRGNYAVVKQADDDAKLMVQAARAYEAEFVQPAILANYEATFPLYKTAVDNALAFALAQPH